jgi:hypothetical protein
MLSIVENGELEPVATEVRRRLGAVIDAVAAA